MKCSDWLQPVGHRSAAGRHSASSAVIFTVRDGHCREPLLPASPSDSARLSARLPAPPPNSVHLSARLCPSLSDQRPKQRHCASWRHMLSTSRLAGPAAVWTSSRLAQESSGPAVGRQQVLDGGTVSGPIICPGAGPSGRGPPDTVWWVRATAVTR